MTAFKPTFSNIDVYLLFVKKNSCSLALLTVNLSLICMSLINLKSFQNQWPNAKKLTTDLKFKFSKVALENLMKSPSWFDICQDSQTYSNSKVNFKFYKLSGKLQI